MAREIGKTTEALSLREGTEHGDAEIGETPGSRIVIAKGPKFLQEYVQSWVMPSRWDTAQLVMANLLRDPEKCVDVETPEGRKHLAEQCFAMADEFVLAARPTLQSELNRYWQQYMTREDELDKAMDGLIEESKDYHLR